MTREQELQNIIKKATAMEDFDTVGEAIEELKQIRVGNRGAFTTVKRGKTQSEDGKNYGKREAVQIDNFNLFRDDGREYRHEKLSPKAREEWVDTPRMREGATLEREVVCGSCKKEFTVHPAFYKPIELDEETGEKVNRNYCSTCTNKAISRIQPRGN